MQYFWVGQPEVEYAWLLENASTFHQFENEESDNPDDPSSVSENNQIKILESDLPNVLSQDEGSEIPVLHVVETYNYES